MSTGSAVSARRRRKAAERAIALGNDDPFDYALALELGEDVDYVEAMPHDRYVRWRAYMVWRAAQQQHAQDVADMRAARRYT